MSLLLLLVLAAPIGQEQPKPLSKSTINRLIRSLEEGSERKAEEAAQELLAGGVEVLPHLRASLARMSDPRARDEVTQESLERVRGLRLMIASTHEEAFDLVLEDAGDSREAVSIRTQHALAVLPGRPSDKLIERWQFLTPAQRQNSVLALIAGGDAGAQDQLVEVLEGIHDETELARSRSALGLRAFAPEDDAIAALEGAVAGSDAEVALRACATLWSYDALGVNGLLVAIGHRNKSVQQLASVLLTDLGDVAKSAVVKALLQNPKDTYLLRIASIVAPADRVTVETFLGLRNTKLAKQRSELLSALPRVEIASEYRIDILAHYLAHEKRSVIEEAVLSALQLSDDEFAALKEPLLDAFLREETSETLLSYTAAAVSRMSLPAKEHLELCGKRMILPGASSKLRAGVLAGSVGPEHDEDLARHVRTSASGDRVFWLSSLTGRKGLSQQILIEAAEEALPRERPSILSFLALGGAKDEAAIDLLKDALADPESPEGLAVIRGLAQLGVETEGLLTPLLKRFDELNGAIQGLVLRAAARCEPKSKRLAAVAGEALAESPLAEVRSAAAAALSQGGRSNKKSIKMLRAALKRGGRSESGDAAVEAVAREGDADTVTVIAGALAELGAKDAATAEALGEWLDGSRGQVMMVSDALRRISPASATQGEALANQAWSDDWLKRAGCLGALAEIEGAAVHADTTLAAVASIQLAELAEVALSGLEALSPDERPFATPYLECTVWRNSWPLTGVGWTRLPMLEPWAKAYAIPGGWSVNVAPLTRFDSVRERAQALLN